MKVAMFAALSAAFILANAVPASAATNLVTNGGFENQPGFTGNPYDYSTTPASWTTNAAWNSNGSNGVAGSVYGQPHSGSYDIRFGSSNTSTPTTLSQTVSDIIGSVYTVSFYTYNGQYVGQPDGHPFVSGGSPNNYLTASVNDQSVTVPDNVGTYSNGCSTCWVQRSFSFTGTGSDTLSFAAKTDANYWFLDDVSITQSIAGAVPEPATWAMMIVGFGAVGAAMRQRKRANVSFA